MIAFKGPWVTLLAMVPLEKVNKKCPVNYLRLGISY